MPFLDLPHFTGLFLKLALCEKEMKKMENITIAILGATEGMGSILANHFAKGSYRLLLFSHKIQELETLVRQIQKSYPAADLESYACLVDASWEADIIVFTVPLPEKKYLAETIRQVATQKIVLHTSDHLRGARVIDKSLYTNETKALQQLLPYSKLIKVYLSTNSGVSIATEGEHIDVAIEGNNIEAVETVTKIFIKTGFNVAVPLIESSTT